MKCDELCVYKDCEDFQTFDRHFTEAYKKSEVDAAIAEIKAENERLVKCCKEYDSRQRIDERIKFNDAQLLRATKRALWIARAKRNRDLRTLGNFRNYVESLVRTTKRSIYHYPKQGYPANYLHKRMMDSFETWCKYLKIAEDKCLKKAEEFR